MRWFTEEQLEQANLNRPRNGGPVYLLLEYVVLDYIGQLPGEMSAKLNVILPTVYDAGAAQDWKAILLSHWGGFLRTTPPSGSDSGGSSVKQPPG